MVIDIPGMEEHPNAHEVRCPIEAVEPQRVTLNVFILGHDDREKYTIRPRMTARPSPTQPCASIERWSTKF